MPNRLCETSAPNCVVERYNKFFSAEGQSPLCFHPTCHSRSNADSGYECPLFQVAEIRPYCLTTERPLPGLSQISIMAKPNCPVFTILQASPRFFSTENDISGIQANAPRLALPPINVLRGCASHGCDLCTVLTAGSTKACQAAELTPFELEKMPVYLGTYHGL